MRVTKKAKHVIVSYKKVTSTISEYSCPSCCTRFVGGGPRANVLRFRCDCGQELIVDKPRRDAEGRQG